MEKNLEIIKQAILNEVEGYQFYKMYSEKVNNKDIADTFMDIANEELSHIEYLKNLMNNSKEENLKMAQMEVPEPGIFKFSSMTPDELSLAVTAFSIAMKMEEDSQKFYDDAAKNAETEEEKALYEKLRDWEISHRDQFEKQYETLKEEWWADNDFAPM